MKNPFELFELSPRFGIDPALVEERYRALQRALHPDRHRNESASVRRAALSHAVDVNAAYRALRDDLSRAVAVLDARSVVVDEKSADPSLLMEMMERREGLAEARMEGQPEVLAKLRREAERDYEEARAALTVALDGDGSAPESARAPLTRMRYLRRFLDELDADESL